MTHLGKTYQSVNSFNFSLFFFLREVAVAVRGDQESAAQSTAASPGGGRGLGPFCPQPPVLGDQALHLRWRQGVTVPEQHGRHKWQCPPAAVTDCDSQSEPSPEQGAVPPSRAEAALPRTCPCPRAEGHRSASASVAGGPPASSEGQRPQPGAGEGVTPAQGLGRQGRHRQRPLPPQASDLTVKSVKPATNSRGPRACCHPALVGRCLLAPGKVEGAEGGPGDEGQRACAPEPTSWRDRQTASDAGIE